MKKLTIYILILINAILLSTCKRYDKGGLSLFAIKNLFGDNKDGSTKVWKLSKYEVNGIDSTSFIIAGNGITNFENDEITFRIFDRSAHDYYATTKVYTYSPSFGNDNFMTINFEGGYYTQCKNNICERSIFIPTMNTLDIKYWKIEKLKKHELIITATSKNSYKIILRH